MRLYAALVREETDQPETTALQGLGRAMAQMDRLETMVGEAWRTMEEEFQAHPVLSAQYVFLAPEYFFSNRRTANDRFFSHDVKRATIDRLRTLSRTYPKLLIVPGTMLWTKALYESRLVMLGRGRSQRVMVPNDARIQKADARINVAAGFGTDVNSIDWAFSRAVATDQRKMAQNVAYLCLNGHILKYQKIGNYREVANEADDLVFVPGSIVGRFSVGNVRYAIEVCMDHALGVLAGTVGAEGTVDAQLVVSSYVSVTRNPNASVTLHSSTEEQQIAPSDDRVGRAESAGTAQVRFNQDGRARLAQRPIRKASYTVWTVDIDVPSAGPSQLRDTALQTVGA